MARLWRSLALLCTLLIRSTSHLSPHGPLHSSSARTTAPASAAPMRETRAHPMTTLSIARGSHHSFPGPLQSSSACKISARPARAAKSNAAWSFCRGSHHSSSPAPLHPSSACTVSIFPTLDASKRAATPGPSPRRRILLPNAAWLEPKSFEVCVCVGFRVKRFQNKGQHTPEWNCGLRSGRPLRNSLKQST